MIKVFCFRTNHGESITLGGLVQCIVGLQNRTDRILDDNGSEFPVHFLDNDRDGTLSAGDEFEVYGQGNGANGPAEDGWSLAIQFDASGDIIGTAKLL